MLSASWQNRLFALLLASVVCCPASSSGQTLEGRESAGALIPANVLRSLGDERYGHRPAWIPAGHAVGSGAKVAVACLPLVELPQEPELAPPAPTEPPQQYRYSKDWFKKKIDSISIDIQDHAEMRPPDQTAYLVSERTSTGYPRHYPPVAFHWVAPNVGYRQLYFENVRLERYGQSCGPFVDPALSVLHFYVSTAMLPYNMWCNPPWECDYPLGFCRPGNCVPPVRQVWFYGQ